MQENRKRTIRMEADSFRGKCQVSRYGIIDLFKECEKFNYKLLRYPLGENADLGFAVKKDNDIIIFTNSSSRLSREIFTLAHEIGHIVLHFQENNAFIDDKVTISERHLGEKEKEANYFAACLLMPEDEVLKFIDFEIPNAEKNGLSAMDIARIMSEFNVSFDMALNRLEDLKIIDADQKNCLNDVKNEKKVGNLLRCVGNGIYLNTPAEVIDIPHEYLEYVIYNYNHQAIPKETLERALEYCRLNVEDISDVLVKPNEPDEDEILKDLMGGLED